MPKVNKLIKNTNIQILINACKSLGIKYQIQDWEKYKLKLTHKNKTHVITSKSLGINESKAISETHNKHEVYNLLKKASLPVLTQVKIRNMVDFDKQNLISFPLTLKPLKGQKGKHVYLNIKNKLQLKKTLKEFKEVETWIIEPYFKAKDIRFLVLNNEVIGLSQRTAPFIKTNGKQTIRQLIKKENQKRLDQNLKLGKRMLNRMLVWPRIGWYLNMQGLNLESIPEKGRKILVYPLPNFTTGGSVQTIPLSNIHPSYLKLALKTAKLSKLTILGIDMLIKDFKNPATAKNLAILEINSDPGLRLHDWPNVGKSQQVAEKILSYIFSS
ncbi:hypothetical protein ACFLZ1_03660 [Patescibacteria group bacterium]